MIEIGENLKFDRFEVKKFDENEIKLTSTSNAIKTVHVCDILRIELTGIKNSSGYCGTMEWGMGNPTFILPINFWYNIINWFKRQDDLVYYKVTVVEGDQFVVFSDKKIYKEISRILK